MIESESSLYCAGCTHHKNAHLDAKCYWGQCECKEFIARSVLVPQDMVNHPPHYTAHPSGVECIQVTEHMNFCIGNAVKYLWRVDDKGDPVENLDKAKWYIEREIARRKGQSES